MAKTIIHKNNQALLGDKNHLEIAEQKPFSDLIFEVLSEKEPNPLESRIFNMILNLSIDHGEDAPSAVATIKHAKKKTSTISEAISEGVLQINNTHGGAIEPCMELLYKIKQEGLKVEDVVAEALEKKQYIGGFGHRLYKDIDPRAELIFRSLVEANIGAEYIGLARHIREEFQKHGKNLVINIDGAIAVALCGFGWDSKVSKAVFISARVPGLAAHFLNNH